MAVSVPETQFEDIRASFAQIGVRQLGDPVLRRPARRVELPMEAPLAAGIIDVLIETMQAARRLHEFTRGIGLAAPQIGHSHRIAVVHPVEGDPITLINPEVVRRSRKTETALEGCLSFFDYRGEVRRPSSVEIAYDDLRGNRHRLTLEGEAARLALHEVDHLDGQLYTDRMSGDATLIEDVAAGH